MVKSKIALVCALLAIPTFGSALLTGCATTERPSMVTVGYNQCGGEDNNEITRHVVAALQADPQLKYMPITVSTCRNVVTLRGYVDSNEQMRRALSLAASAERGTPCNREGVAWIKNGLKIRGFDGNINSDY